jgi:DNA helicase-2/ATP-dependent DNA helicase PcrA
MEEQTFPSRRAVEGDVEDLEEERRLCYVAVTRAMRELNLLAARFRRIYGSEEVRRPSRFLGDLPDSVVTTFGSPSSGARSGGGGGGRGTIRSELRRGARDDVVYDDDGFSPSEPVARIADDDGFRVGDRVFHNTFEHGVVESVSGTGPQAHLTVRFPTEGVRRVVARFVRRAK